MISLIITTCDRAELLKEALDSADQQQFLGEIIVVNDGRALPEPLSDRVKIIKTKGYTGVSSARNAGLAAASMPYISYLDDDDLLHPNAYQGAMDAFKAGDHNLVVSNVELFDQQNTRSERVPPSLSKGTIWGMDFSALSEGTSFFTKQSTVYKTDFLRSIGGWQSRLRTRQLSELFLRISQKSDITGVNWPCYRLRRSADYDHLTDSLGLRIKSQLFLFVRHFPLWASRKSGWRWLAGECLYTYRWIRRRHWAGSQRGGKL